MSRISTRVLVGAVATLMTLTVVALGGGPAEAAERSTEHLGNRSYEMYRPTGLPEAAPLVVVLHGGYGSGRQAQRSYGWDAQADAGKFVAVFPNGTNRSWNGGSCCGPAERNNVDDVGFIRQVVADVSRKASIDPDRVFVTGMSNGAIMAYRLVCETDLFAAAAPVAGTLGVPCSQPASVLHIHGDADTRVPYGGGPGKAYGRDGARVDGPAIPAVIAGFRDRGNCSAAAQTVRDSVTTSIAACPEGRAVGLITIAGAGHEWPGGRDRLLRGRPTTALDATSVIWEFFASR